jgi:hypothetical protein
LPFKAVIALIASVGIATTIMAFAAHVFYIGNVNISATSESLKLCPIKCLTCTQPIVIATRGATAANFIQHDPGKHATKQARYEGTVDAS